MDAMDKIAAALPAGFDHSWTGLSYQDRMSGKQAPVLYTISLIVVFLILAALYESWTIPLAVLMAVPAGIIGALGGIYLRGMNNDIYFQIALLAIVGLSAKNSILIVEFARAMHQGGKNLLDATIEASRLRLRPIIMTSLCFVLGVVPLTISSGAGSGGQNVLGTAVMAGTITASAMGIYYTPLFFYLVTREFIGERMAAQESLVDSTQRSYLHASSRYDAGVNDYLNVLDAKRSLYAAQIGLIGARLSRASNALMLYKTLGGGWQ